MQRKSLITRIGEAIDSHRTASQVLHEIHHTSQSASVLSRWHRLLPTPGSMIFTLLTISVVLWAQNVGAIALGTQMAASTSISGIPYQGRLADASGNPLTQTVNIVFRLYPSASGGAPLWEEQWTGANSVQASDGLFNVMLGSVSPISQGVITGNNNLFLGITVGTDSEMVPRVQLGSVPFATQALTVPDGSITTAKIADGVVTKAKLDPTMSFEPAFQFGGVYVVNPHTGACQSNNPFTSGCTCPPTFSSQLISEISHGVDGFTCNGVKCYAYMCNK